ncbi:MAG: hypothetical protein QOC73_2036, partial [Actinomycetota bacterium]|nr:hypothetical protein [Actinomycetota bacterium]
MDRAQLTDEPQLPAPSRGAAQLGDSRGAAQLLRLCAAALCDGGRGRTVLRAAYALMGVLLAAYLASLIVRAPGESSQLLDGWLVAAFELVVSAMCIARGFGRRTGRAVAVTLGFGLLMWSLGDLALTVESSGSGSPPTPSLADVFYLGFYPLTYVAVVIFMRGEVRKLATPSWLDGAVAGLGTASACAAFLFDKVLHL